MSGTRVVVTGLGTISPLALTAPRHFERVLAGESAVEKLDDPAYRNYPPILHARVQNFDRRELIPDRMLRKLLSPSPAYALAAATEALRDAGLAGTNLIDCGIYIGSVCLDADPEAFIPALRESIDTTDNVDLGRFATHGIKLIDPLFLVKSLPNAGLCAIAIQHQALGPNANITNGSVSGLQAIIGAMDALRRGDAEMVLAGGYDSLLRMDSVVDHLLAGRLAGNGLEPAKACRPFDRRRSGYALAEGAAFLMLETPEHAQKRGARIYGELRASGQTAVPQNFLEQRAEDDGLAACARQALDDDDQGVDLILGDGLANALDDGRELHAAAAVANGRPVPYSAFTGSFGFPGAAAGAFSLVHAMLAIHGGVMPPMINCEEPAADANVDLVREPRAASMKRVLVWTSDRGIKNAAVLAAAPEH
ncbi:MAG TPA: beta-ketoacyl synthase N-terminal-like domain-containing protein [Thermoanaerobaculia bacterium]